MGQDYAAVKHIFQGWQLPFLSLSIVLGASIPRKNVSGIESSPHMLQKKKPSDLCQNRSSYEERISDILKLWYGQTTQCHPYLLFQDNQSLLLMTQEPTALPHHTDHASHGHASFLHLSKLLLGRVNSTRAFYSKLFSSSWENRSLVTKMASGHLVMLSLFSLSVPQKNLLFLFLCLIYSPPACSLLFPPLAAKWLRNGKKWP